MPESKIPIKLCLESLPSNVYSQLNVDVPIWIEWIEATDTENKVRFREKIFIRIVKEVKLTTENIKKDISTTNPDVFDTLLSNIVDDLFDNGFVSSCLDRLETHPEKLYQEMDNELIVTSQNLQFRV